jgi:RNA polymerase sigma factor (sigma-70 family)
MQAILRQLRRAALLSGGDGPSDAQLLESFLSHRDEVAFEALVRRHGPMVLAVCRRVTGNVHDADDAFQATFLVLVRKAASLRARQLLPGWLYGVAYRTALNTRTMKKKRWAKEQQAAQQPRPEPDDGPPQELLDRLDEALHRLPDRYRLPVVLCELQGRSRKEAAKLLDLPVGTVSWRLAYARKLLAQRLARYGTMLSAGALTALLSQNSAKAVPAALVRAVTLHVLMTGTVSAPVQALTEGVLKVMLLSKLKLVWGVALAAVVGVGTVGLMYRPAVAADPQQTIGAAARATADEIEELRLEIAALRKGLQATRERVKVLESQVATLRGPARSTAGVPGGASAMGMTWLMQQQMMMRKKMGQGMSPVGPTPMLQPGAALPASTGNPIGLPGVNRGQNPASGLPAAADQRPLPAVGLPSAPRLPKPGDSLPADRRLPSQGSALPDRPLLPAPGSNQPVSPRPAGPSALPYSQLQSQPRPEGPGAQPGEKPRANSQPKTEAISEYRRALGIFADEVRENKIDRQHDPLVAAQAALKQLRKHPDDTKAADRLERALKALEMQRKMQRQ